jgi:hypothetical protein
VNVRNVSLTSTDADICPAVIRSAKHKHMNRSLVAQKKNAVTKLNITRSIMVKNQWNSGLAFVSSSEIR